MLSIICPGFKEVKKIRLQTKVVDDWWRLSSIICWWKEKTHTLFNAFDFAKKKKVDNLLVCLSFCEIYSVIRLFIRRAGTLRVLRVFRNILFYKIVWDVCKNFFKNLWIHKGRPVSEKLLIKINASFRSGTPSKKKHIKN